MSAADEDVPVMRQLCRTVMPTGFAMIAFFLGFIGSVRCDAIKFTSTSGFDPPVTVQFGFWSHEDIGFYNSVDGDTYLVLSCASYDSDVVDIDSKWKASMAFSIIPLVLGGIALFWMLFTICEANKWQHSVAYFLAFFFQSLSLLLLESNACNDNGVIRDITDNPYRDGVTFEETCRISTGIKCVISAVVFWFLAAFTSADGYLSERKKRNGGASVAPMEESLIRDDRTNENKDDRYTPGYFDFVAS